MVPGIAVLFYRSSLNMAARERNSIESLLFSIRRVNQSIKKIFLKVLIFYLLRCGVLLLLLFFETNFIQDGVKTLKIKK